jgi:hypothetical protein
MNKKALIYGALYSFLVIGIKLSVWLGGYSLSRFGFYYSNIVCVFLILPFYILVVKSVRDKDYNGVIGGREASRLALTVFVVGAILTSIYNYAEYELNGKHLAVEYYHSPAFLDYLKKQPNIKAENYSKIIEEQVKTSEVSAFKATTGKLFSLMIIGVSGAVIVASILKRSPRQA